MTKIFDITLKDAERLVSTKKDDLRPATDAANRISGRQADIVTWIPAAQALSPLMQAWQTQRASVVERVLLPCLIDCVKNCDHQRTK